MPVTLTRSVTYDVVTEESAEHGDVAEAGYSVDPEPVTFRDAVDDIRRRGIESVTAHRSYVTVYHYPEQDYRSGAWTTEATHLDGDPRVIARLARILEAAR